MTTFDLLIKGGTIISRLGRYRGNIAISGGTIAYIGPLSPDAARTFDADGLMILPGGVDTHVHLMDPGSTDREDFPTGTNAAAAAGVTTIIEHSHNQPVRAVEDLVNKRGYLRGRSNVDYGLAAHAWPGSADQVSDLWAGGVSFFKVFTCSTHGIPGHDAAALNTHLKATSRVGAVSLMHCEDESLTESAEKYLREQGREDGGVIFEWRNRDAEVIAAAVASILIRRSGARAVVAHVSNPEVADYISRERASGANIGAEACPQYFILREDEVIDQGSLRKFTPPARARTDRDEETMWNLLRDGILTHMSTDHAPSTMSQKRTGNIWDVHFGLPGLDSTMALLIDSAIRERLAWEDIARIYSEVPARTYGLWPKKGTISLGSDADIVLVDPSTERTLRNEDVISKAQWTPYHGKKVRGQVVATYLRGTLIAENRTPADLRSGQFIPGPGFIPNK